MKGIILVACAVTIICGCGYTTQSLVPEQYRTIYVPAFENTTMEFDLQAPLTDAVRRKFMSDGRLRVVNSEEKADLILKGAVTKYELDPLVETDDDQIAQFRVFITATCTLIDAKTGLPIWKDVQAEGKPYLDVLGGSSFYSIHTTFEAEPRGTTDFFLKEVRSFPTRNEGEGASEAIEDLANNIFLQTIDLWWFAS